MWQLFVVVLACLAIWRYLQTRNEIFKRLDIKGPTPTLLFGNLFDIYKIYKSNHPLTLGVKLAHISVSGDILRDWTKQYGKVYGYFEGGTPIMVMSDPDMLTEVFVKQFSNFHGRKIVPHQSNPDTSPDINLFLSRGSRWKRLRNITNPTFSSMKMKQMYPIITCCVDELVGVLDDKCKKGEAFNIHTVFQGLTLDVIARTAFGYESSVQSNPNHPLLELMRKMFHSSRTMFAKIFIKSGILLPEIRDFFIYILSLTARWRKDSMMFVKIHMKQVIEERKKQKGSNEGVKDFIQLMLEAETTEDHEPSEANTGNDKVGKKLTTGEMISQSFGFIVAGFETTSIALSFITYLLALYPDVQEKVYEEIQKTVKDDQTVSYETVQALIYMDMVIKETLRVYPFAQSVIVRRCMKSCSVNGVPIPEGMNVCADVLSLHFDEEHWGDNAKEFKPDRFSVELSKNRHPMVYMPFGAGPRNCIGMRFAMLEVKLALCKVLQKYKINTCSKTKIPKNLKEPSMADAPNEVFIVLEERTHS